jgi:hypothetical protein
MGNIIELCSSRVYNRLEIVKRVGETDAGAVLLFKNPNLNLPLSPPYLQGFGAQIAPPSLPLLMLGGTCEVPEDPSSLGSWSLPFSQRQSSCLYAPWRGDLASRK